MFPRLSETFILNEILALEAQGLEIRVLSLKRPDSPMIHRELASIRARVNYLPESVIRGFPRMLAAQVYFLRCQPLRWMQALALVLRRWSLKTTKRWLQAGIGARLLEGSDVTHIHAHFAHAPTTVAMIIGIFLELPFSFTAHAKDIFHGDNHYDMVEVKMNRARFIVTVSEFNRNYLARLSPAAAAKVHVVRNGLPLASFRPRPHDPGGHRILAVGRLVEKKGFTKLVEACAILACKGIRFECDILGEGPERARIDKTIKRYDLAELVHLVGAVDDETLRHFYNLSTVFALPCCIASTGDMDGLPTVLVEAMALGIPVLTTTVAGIPELVLNECTGLLVPPDDPSALATALKRVLDDAQIRQRLVMAGREKVEREYRLEVNVSKLVTLFGGVVS